MKKIGIVTLFDYFNIGNKLQNYALQQVIENNGYEVETIACSDLFYTKKYKRKIAAFLGFFVHKYREEYLFFKRRFIIKQRTCKLIKSTKNLTIKQIYSDYGGWDGYLVGSDQVWHDWKEHPEEMNFRFLKFVPSNKRMCYAPSFGFDTLPEDQEQIYREGLNGFEILSSREQSGCDIEQFLTGKNPILVCDPTMLLTDKEWDTISEKPIYSIPDNFVLVYFLSPLSESQNNMIKKYAEKNNCQIIDIYNHDLQDYYFTTPQQFLYLIRRAKYIFTNSFHGTVFSIIYHKQFTVFSREGNSAKMNGRTNTLLSQFSLHERLNTICESALDCEFIDTTLSLERIKGKKYLSDELLRITKDHN